MQYLQPVKSFLHPEKIEQWDFSAASKAAEKEHLAKITRAALFIFTTLVTTAVLVLTDVSVVLWPIAGPLTMIMLIAGVAFYFTNDLEARQAEGLNNDKRAELVKDELERLFFHEKLENWNPKEALTCANKLLRAEIFTEDYIQKITELTGDKTLCQAAENNNLDLSFSKTLPVFIRGWYGDSNIEYTIEMHWSGKQENSLVCKIQEQEQAPDFTSLSQNLEKLTMENEQEKILENQ